MTEARETATRWEPVTGIPETPCYDFVLSTSEMRRLSLRLKYSLIKGNKHLDLLLDFQGVIAFRSYWDGDGILELKENPRCADEEGWPWPLLIIENSQWLASADLAVSRYLAEARGQERWRHFKLRCLE